MHLNIKSNAAESSSYIKAAGPLYAYAAKCDSAGCWAVPLPEVPMGCDNGRRRAVCGSRTVGPSVERQEKAQ